MLLPGSEPYSILLAPEEKGWLCGVQQRTLASHPLAAGNEEDTWKAWVTLLLHTSVSESSLTSLVLGLSTQMRNHSLSILYLDKQALWYAENNQTQKVPGILT